MDEHLLLKEKSNLGVNLVVGGSQEIWQIIISPMLITMYACTHNYGPKPLQLQWS